MAEALMQRVGTVIVVAAMLVAGHPVMAGEKESEMRSDLTLGGRSLAQRLHAEPILSSAAVQASLARLNGNPTALARAAPTAATSGDAGPKRQGGCGRWFGAGIGVGVGVFVGLGMQSYCHNEGSSGLPCWSAVPLFTGLSGIAGYGIAEGIGALVGKLRGRGAARPDRTP